MDYVGILDMPTLGPLLLSVIQTATIFIFVLAGLKLVGRRVFGQQSPQDLLMIVLIAEASDIGLSDTRAGYWGTLASVATLLLLGWTCERVTFLRKLIDPRPITLFENGRLNRKALQKHMLDEEDLDLAARGYGLSGYKDFSTMVLEGDGKITGVEKR